MIEHACLFFDLFTCLFYRFIICSQVGKDRDGIPYRGIRDVLSRTLHAEGQAALWSGIHPRVVWIGIGGFVFFGAYEASRELVEPVLG